MNTTYTFEDLLVPCSEILTHEVKDEGKEKTKLFLGNGSFAEDKNLLANHGVKHVLTVTRSKPRIDYSSCNIEWLQLEVGDTPDNNIFQIFDVAFKFIEECLEKGNVLVHCDAGQSRSGCVMVAFIMKRMKISLEEALIFVKKRRKCVDPNSGFMKQLEKYEKKILE